MLKLPERLRRRRGMSAVAIAALAGAGFAGCTSHAHESGQAPLSRQIALRIRANPVAAAQNGPFFALVPQAGTPEPVLVVDLRTGRRIRLARTRSGYGRPVAIAGSTVVWLEDVGGNEQTLTLRAAAPRHGRRLARWTTPAYAWTPDAPFGGVAAAGRHLVYSLFFARYVDPDACIDTGACRAYVRGGGTFLVSPQSLAPRRILPPARAVAADGDRVAAAVVRRGALYTGKAQLVVLNLASGARRSVGAPTASDQLALGRNLVVGIAHRTAQTVVRVWNIRTGSLVKTLRFRLFGSAAATVVAARLPALDSNAVFEVDLKTGRRRVISRMNGVDAYAFGPWVWRQRVYWLEKDDGFSELRSAPLPH